MLSRFDDYPIHQTPEPIAHPATSDRNVYDRYWFNGYQDDAGFYFGVAMGLYPHRGVLDCAFSLVIDGEQHAFHASRRAPADPSETVCGPFRLEIIEPMRVIRLVIDDNETGIACDLTFTARTACVEEGRQTLRNGARVSMDATRFAQFGRWQGEIRYAGRTLRVEKDRVFGTKDRSWGVRPVGEPETGGAPGGAMPHIFFLWAPIHWTDRCTHFGCFDDASGFSWHQDGALVPVHDGGPETVPGITDPNTRSVRHVEHAIEYLPGTRRARSARIALIEPDGARTDIELEPLLCFRMKGLGYTHPVWGHGRWHDELAIGGERFSSTDLEPMAMENQHIQQVVRARCGDAEGIGVLEQIAFGPHARYGFKEFLDPAS
jgi:hypothetical protein